MTHFDTASFKKFRPTDSQLKAYFQNARRDLDIALNDGYIEVRFTYAYQALIKGGIALLAQVGAVRVRSIPGHHVKILEKMSEILHEPDVFVIGNAMRMKRNLDLYEGGTLVSEEEAKEFLTFVEGVLERIEKQR